MTKITSITAALLLSSLSSLGEEFKTILPDHPSIQYRGRVNFTDPLAPRLTWAGTRMDFMFIGTSVSVSIHDSGGSNYFNVFINEEWSQPVVLACRQGEHRYEIARDLPGDQPTRVTMIKRTESREGVAHLRGIHLDADAELCPPPTLPALRIEFYGDSITSGLGNIAPDDAEDKGNATKDNTLAYGSLTARKLNADYRAISSSGIGLTRSWFPFTLPQLYDRLEGTGIDGPAWDFSQWTPNVVVINVGQNDCWLLGNLNPTIEEASDVIRAYEEFYAAIRGHYPDAWIIAALGPMNAVQPGSAWPGFVEHAVALRREAGDERIASLIFPQIDLPKHPRARHHEAMAEQLTAFINTVAVPDTYDPAVAEEFRPRRGMPNVFSKIQAGEKVRIAYLGGSITAAYGWRPKTTAWFRQQFPEATFVEINPAISGTGSDYSACRLGEDVLVHRPDLVLLECRVNGGGGFEQQSVEGIVRQVWRYNPQTDICFVYTISQGMLRNIGAGRQTPFGTVMETIANRYGIPTIDLGVEVAKREQAGTLVFNAAEPVEGKLRFTMDGTHPTDEGHQLYFEILARSFLAMQDQATPLNHGLGEPLAEDVWETATLLPISEARLSAGWMPVDPATDEVYRDDLNRTKGMLRNAVKSTQVGETITVRWHGTTLGFSDIPHGGTIEIEVAVNGGEPIVFERMQANPRRRHARFLYLPALSPGEHEAVLTVRSLPEDGACYAGHVLVIGTPLPPR